ncbi:ThiF family adenylyltransferase [Neptunicella marina]|uniref:ThiF family adenylyltransferase n=1 Tax=Neptunicella marina TaxID=2125989 RepID=A0A8J6M1V8_9ALTE|nr:ThiF family adenylyltransferase [Neptunicella marina]MBC3765787.1 ThiF family adenylyltransferase [Neptunicella marina]
MFKYEDAFSRNIGWYTEEEQQQLRGKKVAIAGCGGVGGIHTLTMARTGIGKFSLADFDEYGIENFNRQIGATMSSVDRPKLNVINDMVLDVNPEAEIHQFAQGINDRNLDEFLYGVDLYIDSLDFFAIDARRSVFAACAERGIPAITAAPLGMGTAFLCFMPGQMTFEEYFGMGGVSETEQYLRFYLGLAPANLQSTYLVDPTRLDLNAKKGPSTIIGCTMSAGVAAAYAVKILLNRGELVCAPEGMHWDPYLNQMEKTSIPNGHKNDEFQAKLIAAKKAWGI